MVNGWIEKPLGDVTIRIASGITKARRDNGKYPLYGSTGLIGFTDAPDYSGKKILIARVGANAGTINVVSGIYGVSDNTLIVEVNDAADLDFTYNQLDFKKLNRLLFGSGQPLITGGQLKEIEILLPKTKDEQRTIAATLSDADAYIAALEKLIAKKCAAKQGTTQKLLTGKQRLQGFDSEWDSLNLATNSTLKARIGWQGLTTAEYLEEGYSYLITGTDFSNGKIAWSGCHYVDKSRYDQDTNIQVGNGDILVSKDGTIGKVAIVNDLTKKATLNSGVFVVRPKNEAYDRTYIYYVLLSQIFADFLAKLAAGSTINHLYQKDFVNFEFEAPADIAEQTGIATVLSDMDAEIDALTAKLEKARHIKHGMMSELLTGRIRLIEEDTDNGEN